MEKSRRTAKTFRLPDDTLEKMREMSGEEKVSMTDIIVASVNYYYARGIDDNNIILGRQAAMERELARMNGSAETFYKLMNFIMTFIFAHLPSLPRDKKEKSIALSRGTASMRSIIMAFRRDEKVSDISFVQRIWGDSQEAVAETYEEGRNG